MKIAILGGSFNPLHNGHAMVADAVIRELHYDKVIFIPTCIPPHKELAQGAASAKDRLGMIEAFCKSEEINCNYSFCFDSCEIDRGGISYTCDTLEYIIEKYKNVIDGKPGFIMGEEIAAEFYKWKNPNKIAELADLIIIPRLPDYNAMVKTGRENHNKPTGEYTGDFTVSFIEDEFDYPFIRLSEPVLTVSSTDIRKRVKTGKSFKYLVPTAVFEYIENNNLYID